MAEQLQFRPTARPVDTVAVNTNFRRLPTPVAPVKPIAPYEPAKPRAPTPSNIDQLAQALAGLNPRITAVANRYFDEQNKEQAADAELRVLRDNVSSWSEAVAKDPTLADRSPVFRQVYEARTARNRVQARAGQLISEYYTSEIAASDDPTAITKWLSERMQGTLDSASSTAERQAMTEEVMTVSRQWMQDHRERARSNLVQKNRDSVSVGFQTTMDNYAARGPAAPYKTDDPLYAQGVKGSADPHAARKAAFLNATAGGESAGKYNIRYDGKAGSIFELNGQHPQVKVPVQLPDGSWSTSDAAGRYQFLSSTWRRVMGDAAFTPENQDLAAIKLAEADYKARTGGRNIWEDIEKEGLSTRIQAVMTPTWQAFKGNRGRHIATFNASLQKYGGKPTGDGVQNGHIPEITEDLQKQELNARAGGMSPQEVSALSVKSITETAVKHMDESYLEVLMKPRPDGTPGAGMTVAGREAIDKTRLEIRRLRIQEQNQQFTLEQRDREVNKDRTKQLALDTLMSQRRAEEEARKEGKTYDGPRGIPMSLIEEANRKDPELAEALIAAQKTMDDLNKREDPKQIAEFQRRVYNGEATPADVFDAISRGTIKDDSTIRNLYEQAGRNVNRSIVTKPIIKPFFDMIGKIIGEETLPGVLQKPLEGNAATVAFSQALMEYDNKNPGATDIDRLKFANETFKALVKTYKPNVNLDIVRPENQAQRQADEAAKRATAPAQPGRGGVTAPTAKPVGKVPAFTPIEPKAGVDWRNTQLFPDVATLDTEIARFKAADNVGNSFTSWSIRLGLSQKDMGEFLTRQRALAQRGSPSVQ